MSLSFTQKRDLAESVVFLFVALVLFTGLWVTRSYFEARTYSRLTGASVSTWDALWVECRVQEGVK
jgi:hypothetical protein